MIFVLFRFFSPRFFFQHYLVWISNLMRWAERKKIRKIQSFCHFFYMPPSYSGLRISSGCCTQFVFFYKFFYQQKSAYVMLCYQISITKTSFMITQDILCDLCIYYFIVVERCWIEFICLRRFLGCGLVWFRSSK